MTRHTCAATLGIALLAACPDTGAPLPSYKGQPAASSRGPSKFEAAGTQAKPTVSAAAVREQAVRVFGPLPEAALDPQNPLGDSKVALGRLLYSDPRLSKNHDISCETCHDLEHYGIDIRQRQGTRAPTSEGHRGQLGERNAPSVYNAGLLVAQFWDGRAATLEEQAKGPILNPVEMAMPNERAVIKVLDSIPGYVEGFKAAFPEDPKPVSYDNLARAIGAFERGLMTPGRFDKFLDGDLSALSDGELRGLQTFIEVGCPQCHSGPAVGGGQMQKLGLIKPWPNLTDEGRAAQTKLPADRFVFKVPSLRNISETGPYLHDGSVATLDKMVELMSEYQTAQGRLDPAKVAAIVEFLGSLKGDLPQDKIVARPLPESGPTTPKPDPS